MGNIDLILLHAPSVYDFREKTILRGPISDLVPSSSVFEMYPIGFTTIANYLEDHDYRVRIINLATRMLNNSSFDVETFISRISTPLVFGIDLHWLPHAHGALEIARLLKLYHPDGLVLLGGFSATYYHRELIAYPQVDFVIRGDSTEEAVRQLLNAVKKNTPLNEVPNLTWRDEQRKVQINPDQHSPMSLDYVDLDFRRLMISSARHHDLIGYLPFMGWLKYPIMPALSCRGCTMNCIGCGGSSSAFQLLHGRSRPVYRSPEVLAKDMFQIATVSKGPIFILGDIRQAGQDYSQRFLDAIQGIPIPVIIELFQPASEDFLENVARALPNFALEFSIESHDPKVRFAYGKPYKNDALEETLRIALNYGATRLDIFFMIGLPYQSYQSVLETADYAENLLREYGSDQRIRPFIGPMAPFVDPGSRAFENPDKYGYRIFARTLEEHRQLLLESSWQFTLNYETRWMTRHEIVHSTYDACIRFVEIKSRHQLIEPATAQNTVDTLNRGKSLAFEIERYRHLHHFSAIYNLKEDIKRVNAIQGIGEGKELQLLSARYALRWLWLARLLLRSFFINLHHPVDLARFDGEGTRELT